VRDGQTDYTSNIRRKPRNGLKFVFNGIVLRIEMTVTVEGLVLYDCVDEDGKHSTFWFQTKDSNGEPVNRLQILCGDHRPKIRRRT
jgi:hypothetical protein